MATELSKLPTDPSVPGTNSAPQIPENIKMETTAYKNDMDSRPNIAPIADTKQMNSMVTELQQASKQGLTRLSEDIPQQVSQVTQDPQALANAIPESHENTTPIDYIQNHATQDEISDQLARQKNKQTTVEYILEEIKIPIFLAILYYCFQSKVFKKFILSKLPSLFNDTGSYSTNGYMAVSLIFGFLFYGLGRVAKHFDL
jgi:hypothetical protein